ncbi:MAG TPA: hypothetical protein VEU96_17910 [Bryobacteraceae bacterium]|nr:hypothetical protein [Bryobacteraceae bacterium]
MKSTGALVFFLLCSLGIATAATTQKKTYYRAHPTAAVRPQAMSDPVVVNAASFQPGICPGGLVTVFGQNLTSVSGIVVAQTDPLPFTLGNVSVLVNGIPAPLFSVAFVDGQDQISFQVPYAAPVGPSAAEVQVFDGNFETADIIADSFTEDPGIFVYNGNYAVAVNSTDGSLIGPTNPAIPGEIVVLYTTGLGPLTLNLRDGYGAPSSPLAYTADPVNVFVDGENCTVYFSGLAPGFVGLYQVNFALPTDLPQGNLELQIQTPFVNSAMATLPSS